MKKINILLATLAMLVATVSCNNDEKIQIEEPGVPAGSIRVNISISDLQPTTKAVKTGWENGDIIHIYLDDAETYAPDFDLTFNGSDWVASSISAAVVGRLQTTGGKLRGFWESSNSCMTDASWGKSSAVIDFPDNGKDGTTGIADHLVADFSNISYTYNGSILEASINSWHFETDLQIVVSGLTFEAGRYTLFSPNSEIQNVNMINTHSGSTPYEVSVSRNGTGSDYGRIAAIQNADGVAFVGCLGTSFSSGETMTFFLIDNTTGVKYEFSKTLTASLSSNKTKINAIKIPFKKFVVDMGFTSGTKWAACNLGADYLTGYGDYYAWGETSPYYSSQSPLTWKTGKGSGYYWTSYDMATAGDNSKFSKYTYDQDSYATSGTADGKITLEAADDAATVAYGSPYRMPTYDDIVDLVNYCNKTYVENYLDSGVNGYLFTSKKTGFTSQKIFFPAAGYYWNTSLKNEGTDMNIWASTVRDNIPDLAWSINGYPSNYYVASNGTKARFFGFSVRPVR